MVPDNAAVAFFAAMTAFGIYSWHSATLSEAWYLTLTIVGGAGTFAAVVTVIATAILLKVHYREEGESEIEEPEDDQIKELSQELRKVKLQLEVKETIDKMVFDGQQREIGNLAGNLSGIRFNIKRGSNNSIKRSKSL